MTKETTTGSTILTNGNKSYAYDSNGRMTNFNGQAMTYDNRGRLTKIGDTNLTYDNYGNRLTKGDFVYTWTRGRLLASVNGTTYTYDKDGVRTKKIVNGVTHEYFYDGDKLIAEKVGDKYFYFFYDESGVCGFRYENINYEYVKNIFGDVIGIYNEYGTHVATYAYDAWGNMTYCNAGTDVAYINPFLYRGYYYDSESGLYYLMTRYYDTQIGRFISPDTPDYLAPDTVGGVDLYAYGLNNPVMYVDPTGHLAITLLTTIGFIFVGGLIGAATSAVASVVTQSIFEGEVDWKSVAVAAGTGFVSGALSASPLGVTSLMVAGAIVEGASYLLDCYVSEQDFSPLGFSVAVVSGIIFAKLGGNGANYKFDLSNAVEHTCKIIEREKRRANRKYAEKATQGAIKWLKGELFDQAAIFAISNYYGSQLGIAIGNFFNWLEKEICSFFDY